MVIMVEERAAVDNLPDMLAQVPGIGVVLIGTADLALDLGHLGVGTPTSKRPWTRCWPPAPRQA